MSKLLLCAALGGLMFVSCNKQTHAPAVSDDSCSRGYNGPVHVIAMGKHSYVSDQDPCKETPGNCIRLKEVVITPNQKVLILDAAANGPTAVGNLFSSAGFVDICNELPAGIAGQLQSGNYAIQLGYNGSNSFNFIAANQVVSSSSFEFAVEMQVSE